MLSRLFQNFCLLLQLDTTDSTLYLSRFPYVDGSYLAPTVMSSKFNGTLLTSNTELFHNLNMEQTLLLLQGLEKEVEASKLGEYDDALAFLAIDEAELLFKVVFCGLNTTSFRCQALFTKSLLLPGQPWTGFGSVRSLQVYDQQIFVITPSRIFEFDIKDVKAPVSYGYTRSMKYVQYFNGKWYGISNADVLFVLKKDTVINELVDYSFFKSTKKHTYNKLIATQTYLIARYLDEDGDSGVTVYYYTDKNFFNEETNATQVRGQSSKPNSGKLCLRRSGKVVQGQGTHDHHS